MVPKLHPVAYERGRAFFNSAKPLAEMPADAEAVMAECSNVGPQPVDLDEVMLGYGLGYMDAFVTAFRVRSS